MPDDATEADMAHARVDGLRMARRRTVAPAVVGRAEVGAALDHLARNAAYRIPRVETAGLCAIARIGGNAARGTDVVAGREPVGRPFPDIADHVVQPVAVGGKATDR